MCTSLYRIPARGEAGLEAARERRAFLVDDDEAEIAAAEGDLVVAVVPPVAHAPVGRRRIAEAHHVGDRSEAVLADPAAHALVEAGRRADAAVPRALGGAADVVGRA